MKGKKYDLLKRAKPTNIYYEDKVYSSSKFQCPHCLTFVENAGIKGEVIAFQCPRCYCPIKAVFAGTGHNPKQLKAHKLGGFVK